MLRLLLNANLSPETAKFLRDLGFDVKSLLEEDLGAVSDEKVVKLAKKERRLIITFDLDFGEIYHFREEEKVGIIVLRLKDQTVESVNEALKEFFEDFKERWSEIERNLVVIEEGRYRFYSAK